MKTFLAVVLIAVFIAWNVSPVFAWNPGAPESPKNPGKGPDVPAPKDPRTPERPGTPPTAPEPPRAPAPGAPTGPAVSNGAIDPNAWVRYSGWSWDLTYAGYIVVWGFPTPQACMKARDEYNRKHRGHVCVPVRG